MRKPRIDHVLAVSLVLTLGAASATLAAASTSGHAVKVCTKHGALYKRGAHGCPKGTSSYTLAKIPKAKRGKPGKPGKQGIQGPPGTLATTPINVFYDATRTTSHDLTTADGVTIRLECGNNRIGTDQANVDVSGAATHGITTVTEYTASTSSTTTSQVDGINSTTALGDVDIDSPHTYGVGYFAGQVVNGAGGVDTISVAWIRDSRQGEHVCTFQGTIAQTGVATVTPN